MATNASTPLQEATRYTIIKTGSVFSMALKMESEKASPLLVRIDKSSNIRSSGTSAELHDFKKLAVGDSLLVGFVAPPPKSPQTPFTIETLRWTINCPKYVFGQRVQKENARFRPGAVVSMALVCGLVPRCKNLAFVADSQSSSVNGQNAYVRIYDPMTLTSTLLPAGHKLSVFPGDPVRVSYAVLPEGAFQPTTGDYTVPHDAPYQKDGLIPQREETYKIISAKRLTVEDMQRFERIYDPSQNRSEEKKAKAVQEVLLAGAAVMQCLVNAEQELGNKKLAPELESQDGEEVVLQADYYPVGKNKREKKVDMVRAARIFRSGQQLQVAPETGPGEPRNQFVLAPIRFSKARDDRISFSFAIPEHVAERIWKDQWQMILQRSFLFKPSTNQVLQRHFHRKLKEGTLRDLLMSGENKPVQQIIKALFGDVDALTKSDINVEQPHKTPAGSMLSMEQTRGLAFATRELLSTIQEAAGSGKTTTTTAITVEQTKHPNSCTAMLAPMNVAIDNSSTQLAKELKNGKRHAIVFQAATYLASRSAEDGYHKYRLPQLLVKLGEGKYGPLTDEETALVKSANLIASRRYRDLRGMDWSSVLHGEVKMEDRADFVAAVKILLEKYKPQIVLGTVSSLLSFADYLAPYITDVVIDEAGTAATLDVACLLMSWTNTRTLTMVGDIHQLPNFTAPMPEDMRKFGFESALHSAATHPNVACTQLSEVYRSHPLIVRVLSAFAYGRGGSDAALKTTVKARDRDLMTRSGLPCGHSPILVVNCRGKHQATAAMSYTNDAQARLAYAVSLKLRERLPKAQVKCLALYSGARDQLNEGFNDQGIELHAGTVDGAQGQECEITILETAYQPDEQHKSKFMDKRERLTVAISRARDGLVIIGDVEALRKLEEWETLFAIIERFCPGAFKEAEDILRDSDTPGTELALSLQSLGLPSHLSPRPSTSGNEQPPAFSALPAKKQSDILKDIVAARGHNYDMSEFEQMYAEVKRSRGEAQLDHAAASQAPSAKRKPTPAQPNLDAIATLVPGVVLPTRTATVESAEKHPDELMDYQNADSAKEQRDPIFNPGAIRRLIEAESEADEPSRNIVVDETPDSSDAEELSLEDAIIRRINDLRGPGMENSYDLCAAALDQIGNIAREPGEMLSVEEMAAAAVALVLQAPRSVSSASEHEPHEPEVALSQEGRADAARQRAREAVQASPPVWHARDAPWDLPRIPKKEPAETSQEPDTSESHKPQPMEVDTKSALPATDPAAESAPQISTSNAAEEEEQLVSRGGRRADLARLARNQSKQRCIKAHIPKREPVLRPATASANPKPTSEEKPAHLPQAQPTPAIIAPLPTEVDGNSASSQPQEANNAPQELVEAAAGGSGLEAVADCDEAMKQAFNIGSNPDVVVKKMTDESIARLLNSSDATEQQAEQQPTSSKKASADDRSSRPKKTDKKPPAKKASGPKKTRTQHQKEPAAADSIKPRSIDDVFGADADQPPASVNKGPSKKEDAAEEKGKSQSDAPKTVKKQLDDEQDDPAAIKTSSHRSQGNIQSATGEATNTKKETEGANKKAASKGAGPSKTPKTWQFPTSVKALKKHLWYGENRPKFTTITERETWKKAGSKALKEAIQRKADKKASGLDVSSSSSSSDSEKDPEYAKLKEAEGKRVATTANKTKPKVDDQGELQKTWCFPASSKAIKKMLRDGPGPRVGIEEREAWEKAGWKAAKEADKRMEQGTPEPPMTRQRSMSREPATDRKKTLLMPPNPPKPTNIEESKNRPSASAYKLPRDSLFPNSK